MTTSLMAWGKLAELGLIPLRFTADTPIKTETEINSDPLLRNTDNADMARRRIRIWYRERGCCTYCGNPLDPTLAGPYDPPGPDPHTRVTLDHVIPKSKGGGKGDDNLVLACFACNHTKGDSLQ